MLTFCEPLTPILPLMNPCLNTHPQTPLSDSLIAAIEVVNSALLNLQLRLHTGPPKELVLKCVDSSQPP